MSFKLKDSEGTRTKMEECITDIRHWMLSNFLKLNDSKTEYLVITKRKMSNKVAHIGTLTIGSSSIPAVPKARNIGCFIDSTLSMEAQVSNVTQRCYASLHQISRIRRYLTEDVAATLVNAQILSKLDGFNGVLIGLPGDLLDKLQLVQNNAARMVTRTKKYEHITPVLKRLHWLPIRSRIEYKIILLCFKALNNLAPKYLSDLLQYKEPSQYNLRYTLELIEPGTKLKSYGDRAFSSIAPRLWNKLPEELRSIEMLKPFKKDLKTHLFRKAYPCTNP